MKAIFSYLLYLILTDNSFIVMTDADGRCAETAPLNSSRNFPISADLLDIIGLGASQIWIMKS